MSRGAFRASVDAPRPASAWALVTVASATLWITQQLDAWAIAVQVLAIVISLLWRLRPHPWQRSAIALNVGMFGIVTATIAVALRGPPSTIALAHFAALSQGLQLLDARPRRTEFLLVTLALFQVVLAANLTDSVFFIPLLVTFLMATVWTLMVHTLHSEAIEAGTPQAVSGAVTPGLARATLVVSSLAVLVALVLFVALPRLRSNVVTGPGVGPQRATAGFSDTVALGDLGRIRQDPTVVLRVETLEGEPPAFDEAYWRGLAFDHFDGSSWSVTPPTRQPVAGSAEGGVSFGPRPREIDLAQRIVREPVAAGVVFAPGEVRRLQGTVRRLERDANGGLYAAGQGDERIRYNVWTRRERPSPSQLDRDTAHVPPRDGERFLALPPLSAATSELALRIIADTRSDAERVRAIRDHLLREGRYTDTPPSLDGHAGPPVEAFLHGGMAGHCEYFASAMVVLARSVGIPARLVNGFAGGRTNRIGGFVEVTRSDAHAWVEVHYERAGWVRYDPTPADLRARPETALSLAARMRELGSALELWWYQRVVGFDRSDQIHAVKRAWLAWRSVRTARRLREDDSGWSWSRWRLERDAPWGQLAVLAVVAVAAGLGLASLLRSRREPGLLPAYGAALRLLERRGLRRPPGTTARAFALRARAELPPGAGAAFAALTESHLRMRFGSLPAPHAVGQLRALRRALAR